MFFPNNSRQSFTDPNYAWDLLQAQVKLETSQIETLTGQDISNLLQLYMRGVQKMNSLVDLRQSFFKNKVTTLMSRTTVIKTLNKPMTKKNKPAIIDCISPIKNNIQHIQKQQINHLSHVVSPSINPKKQLELKQKKQSMEMRLAYSAQENNQDKMKKLMAQHNQKQTFMTKKIDQIVDSHQQKLKKRINDRKLKTLTCKSKSEIFTQDQIGTITDFDICTTNQNTLKNDNKTLHTNLHNLNHIQVDLNKHETTINSQQKHQNTQNPNSIHNQNHQPNSNLQSKNRKLRRISSLEQKRNKFFSSPTTNQTQPDSPTRRKISADIHEIQKMSIQKTKIEQIQKYVTELKQKRKKDQKE